MVYIATKEQYLFLRGKKLCSDFTDEELEKAITDRKPIKKGWVTGYAGEVEMWVDLPFPVLEKANYNLEARYVD